MDYKTLQEDVSFILIIFSLRWMLKFVIIYIYIGN